MGCLNHSSEVGLAPTTFECSWLVVVAALNRRAMFLSMCRFIRLWQSNTRRFTKRAELVICRSHWHSSIEQQLPVWHHCSCMLRLHISFETRQVQVMDGASEMKSAAKPSFTFTSGSGEDRGALTSLNAARIPSCLTHYYFHHGHD